MTMYRTAKRIRRGDRVEVPGRGLGAVADTRFQPSSTGQPGWFFIRVELDEPLPHSKTVTLCGYKPSDRVVIE